MSKDFTHLFDWQKVLVKSNLRSSTRLVAFVLSHHMNREGESCFPSVDTICDETQLSRQTVLTCLKELEEKGWIRVRKECMRGKDWKRNMYKACIPKDYESQLLKDEEKSIKRRSSNRKSRKKEDEAVYSLDHLENDEKVEAVKPLDRKAVKPLDRKAVYSLDPKLSNITIQDNYPKESAPLKIDKVDPFSEFSDLEITKIFEFLMMKVKEKDPAFPKPDIRKKRTWYKHIAAILKGRTAEDVISVIEFGMNHSYYAAHFIDAVKLSRRFQEALISWKNQKAPPFVIHHKVDSEESKEKMKKHYYQVNPSLDPSTRVDFMDKYAEVYAKGQIQKFYYDNPQNFEIFKNHLSKTEKGSLFV